MILFLKDEPRSCGYEEHHRAWSLPSGPGRGGLSNREHRLGMQMTRQARVAQQTSALTVSRFILTHFLCERRHQASQQHGASALAPRPKPFHTEDHRSFRPYPGIGPGGSQSEAVWTNASEKLPLPRKQYQPLRSKEHAKWLVVELELTSANEKFKPPNEHRSPSLTRPLRPGCSLDGGPPTPSPRGSCLHAGRAARPRPRHPDAQPLEPRGPRRPFLGYFLSRHQIRHSI